MIFALGVVQILTWVSSFDLPAVLPGPVAESTRWPLARVVGLSPGLLIAAFASPHVGAATHASPDALWWVLLALSLANLGLVGALRRLHRT